MASVQVVSPFEIFTDVDGNPLEDGFVYIGQAGVDPIANPVSTFFDSALTVPAPQPIRTKGGYASNAGVPSRVFIAQNAYSTLVKNKNSFQILLSLTSPPAFLVGPASSTDNELPLFSGTSGNALKGTGTIVTAQGRALLDDATAAAQRTTLGSTAVGDAVFIAANAAAARTAIGAVIGTDVQAQDADLQALADNATNGLLARTGAGTAAARTITGTANEITVGNGDGVSGNPTVSLPATLSFAGKTITNLGTVTTADINGGTLDGTVIGGASAAAGTFTTTSQTTATVSTSINLTGGQIAFPATQIPSANPNTLDDYEKGTWTPVITFVTPGDLSVVYSLQSGRYTKIGQAFLWEATMTTTTFTYTTATGNLRVSGLPFAAAGTPPVVLARWTGIVSAVATPQITALVNASNVQFEVMNVAAGTTATLTQANAASGVQKSLFIGGNYAT